MKNKTSKNKGFTLVEVLIYIACLVLIMSAIVEISISVNKVYSHIHSINTLENSAINVLHQLSKDIHNANQVQSISTSPAHFIFTSEDGNGNMTTQEYYVENGIIYVKKNNTQVVALNDSLASVSNFEAYPVFAGSSTALTSKISLQVFDNGATTTEDFWITDMLGGK